MFQVEGLKSRDGLSLRINDMNGQRRTAWVVDLGRAVALTSAIVASIGGAAVARENFSTVEIPPAPEGLKVDGDLADWDPNTFVETFYDRSLYPNFSLRIALLQDARGLCIGAHVVDATPMVNATDPAVNPKEGWMGDCLQVRLISDPKAPNPYVGKPGGKEANEAICHLTIWYCTARQEAAISHEYGMDFHGLTTDVGDDSGCVFRKDADGKGYTLEARIPWARLHVAGGRGLRAGDSIPLTVQPLWGNAAGTGNAITFSEFTARSGVGYQDPATWGRATFTDKPAAKLRPNPALAGSGDPAANPLSLQLTLDDPQARVVSLGVFDEEQGLVRSLPVTVRRDSRLGAKFSLEWDGLDADGRPLPPATYQLKQLTHRGIGQKFIASLHNAGNPPWKTDDGLGQWGGDWSPPVAAAADAQHVYLGWGSCEAGPAIVCVKKELDKNGLYQKVWGATPAMHNDVGFPLTALTTDGERLFVAQDGKTYGGYHDKNADAFAAITVYDAKTGRPLKFPFGKPRLPVAQWKPDRCAAERDRPLFERRKTGDFGPQQLCSNLTGIAVHGDMLYAALLLDDKVVACNWRTGETIKEYPATAPSGVAVDPQGRLLVASGKGVLRIDPASGSSEMLGGAELSRPWGVAVDAAGNIVVSDCGKAMQVKVFNAAGKLLRSVGKPGGRAWIGAYDPTGMLMPAGIATDADGKLWVTENDEFPRRVSVWDAAGRNVGDYHGPCVPQTDRGIDPAHPSRINCQMVEYELDYDIGKYTCRGTLWRPHVEGWTPVENVGRASRLLVRHAEGREYAFLDHGYSDRLGLILIRKGDHFQACGSLGYSSCVPVMRWGNEECAFGMVPDPEKWLTPEQWKAVREPGRDAFCHPMQLWHTWVDTNGDGVVQREELTLERRDWSDQRSCVFTGVDDDLTLWGLGGHKDVYRIAVKEFTSAGVPLYPARTEFKPLFTKASSPDASIWMDAAANRVYGFEAKGGDSRMRGEYAGVSCYDLSGKLLWLYRDTWLGFASDSPFWKPGRVIGVSKVIGQVTLDGGIGLLAMPGYYGDYSVLSTDGLWVHEFCHDNRLGGDAASDTVFIENMTGIFFRNSTNGKTYLIGGDIDARVWEVTGLETIRTTQTPLTITPEQFAAATAAAAARARRTAAALPPIPLPRAAAIKVDGKLADWGSVATVAIEAGAGRGAQVSLAYDDTSLYAAFRVDDRSPLANAATDPAVLFKGGDVCDIMLAADPKVDPAGKKPVTGDTRLSFSVLDGKPVCVVYQAVSTGPKAPKTFASPTGSEAFERVQVLDKAQVAVERTANGYVLEAAVPLAEIGFEPAAGVATRGDVGVLYGTDGGGRTVLRAYYANKDTSVVEDVPSEARLAPAKWTTVEVAR